jgi:hypothetical protein
MIKVTTYTKTGSIFKVRVYKTKKSARRALEKQDLEYGSYLRREAVSLETNEKILI